MSDMQRPGLTHQRTSRTLHEGDPTNIKKNDQSVEEVVPPGGSGYSICDILLLLGIFSVQILPWIFFGVVSAKNGIVMNSHVAEVVKTNPHATTYLITLICSIFSMIVTTLFSLAIVRFTQEWVSRPEPTQLLHIQVLLAFRHQKWPRGKNWKGFKCLMTIQRFWLAVLVVICSLAFLTLVSNITSLITPGTFDRRGNLNGSELDFASTNADCLSWFETHPLSNNCDWQTFKNLSYTSCLGENQMVDVLEAGRGNILELISNNTQSLTFSQLGGNGGLHFLGAIRGILPIGPNGVPAFNTLQSSALENPKTRAEMLSYNYTLNYQGLTSNISCSYDSYGTKSPITLDSVVPGDNLVLQYSANCTELGESEVLDPKVQAFRSPYGNNTLTYWACQSVSSSQTPSYSIYLRGLRGYQESIGGITCTVSPIQSAIFPVTYRSTTNIFSANETNAPSPITFSYLISQALTGLGTVISEGQSFQANQVAESVITFGVKFFNQTAYNQSDQYLRLYENMIQGIIEYEVTYLRLIYSTVGSPPTSCIRTIDGSFHYALFGWFVNSDNISFMLSMTIINLAALIALILAMIIGKTSRHGLKASDPRVVTYAQNNDPEDLVPDEWEKQVAYQPRTVLRECSKIVTKELKDGAKKLTKDAKETVNETFANEGSQSDS